MRLTTVVPVLRIFDLAKAREFYVEFLGFTVDWEHRFDDHAPIYLQVSRDGCVLHLSEHHGDATPGSAVRIRAEDVRAYQRELAEKTYRFARPNIEETPWEAVEMSVADPFGNRLIFTEPVGE